MQNPKLSAISLFFSSILIVCLHSHAFAYLSQKNDPNTLVPDSAKFGQMVFHSLQEDNFMDFVNMIIPNDVISKIMHWPADSASQKQLNIIKTGWENNMKQSFSNVREQYRQQGINWEQAEFINMEIHNPEMPFQLKLVIQFEYEQQAYNLLLENCYLYNNRLYIGNQIAAQFE